LHFLIL